MTATYTKRLIPKGRIVVDVCDECGSLVFDREAHENLHATIASLIRAVGRLQVLTPLSGLGL